MQSWTIERIQEEAKRVREWTWPAWEDVEPREACVGLWQSVQASPATKKKEPVPTSDLFRTGLKEGDGRDEQAFQLACRLRDWHVPPEGARQLLALWDASQETPLAKTDGEDILEKKVQNAYGEKADLDDRIVPGEVRSLDELAEDYQAYVETLKARKVTLGYPKIDRYMRGISPGEVCTVIAKTSVGKTAFLQNVLRNIALKRDQTALFASMEQPKAQVFERWAQMATKTSGRDIEKGWGESAFRDRTLETMRREMGDRLWTCDLPRLRMDELERLAWMAKGKAGRLDVLAIDYLGLLDTKDLDRTLYGQISEAARQMKSLAKSLDLAVICLCQISRSVDDRGDKPLLLSSARESGAIEESCDFLIGLHRPYIQRPEAHPEDDMIVLQLLKNRKGQTGALECAFDLEISLRITEEVDRPDDGYGESLARQQGEGFGPKKGMPY